MKVYGPVPPVIVVLTVPLAVLKQREPVAVVVSKIGVGSLNVAAALAVQVATSVTVSE
jgi:hypothetical protein